MNRDTYALNLCISADDIYNKLSDELKKNFNRVIITDTIREPDNRVIIRCELVNNQHEGGTFGNGLLYHVLTGDGCIDPYEQLYSDHK